MSQSIFNNNGAGTKLKGGALNFINCEINIQNSTFIGNKAEQGGAISFEWTSINLCNLSLSNSTLIGNTGIKEGGAIYYNYRPPTIQNVHFDNNSAPYGNNLASYPYRIGLINSSKGDEIILNDVGSGIVLENSLKLALFDFNDQIMVQDSLSQLIIVAEDPEKGTTSGFNTAVAKKGISIFQGLSAIARPGSLSVKFVVSTKAIDKQKLLDVFNITQTEEVVVINFRYCKTGEQIDQDRCVEWAANTYALEWNSTEWIKWMDMAVCLGGEKVSVSPGNWRRFKNSTFIAEWVFREACLGGYNQNNLHPSEWKEGYEGNMWTSCSITEEAKYSRYNEFEWRKWPPPLINAVQVFGIMLIVFSFLMSLIVLNVKKTEESHTSTLLRIMTNYLQLVTTSMSMSLSYPSALTSLVSPFTKLGGASDSFLSFDCFIIEYEIKGPFESNSILKLFLLAFLPIILFLIVALIWVIVYVINKKYVKNITRNLFVSAISILFLLHPKLTQQSINVFRWIQIDEGVSVARFDTNLRCYSFGHIKYCILLAIPILLIWVISMPTISLILLFRNRKERKDNKIKQYFLILYQGLRPQWFYWEFVNTLRKILILASLLLPNSLKVGFASIVLIISGRLQMHLKPYKEKEYNKVELLAMNSGLLIILSNLVFFEKEKVDLINTFITIFAIFINLIFILQWAYLLSFNFKDKYIFSQLVSFLFLIFLSSPKFLGGFCVRKWRKI